MKIRNEKTSHSESPDSSCSYPALGILAGDVACPPFPYLEAPMIKFLEALLDILAPILSVLDRNGKL